MTDKDEIRMSYSSMSEMHSCEMKYAHRKIFKSNVDVDITQDTTALRVGSCFHFVLEICKHDYSLVTDQNRKDAFKRYEIEDISQQGLLIALWEKYQKLHTASGLTVIACEEDIGDYRVVGSIDVVLQDRRGYWFICDLKTASQFSTVKFARLNKDRQLNLYTYFRGQVAEKYSLDLDMFAGVIYRVALKSRKKIYAKETLDSYVKRLENEVEIKDVFIPIDKLEPKDAYDDIINAQRRAMLIKQGDEKPIKNFASCEAWFRPCNYFSQCHGHLHSEGAKLFPERTDWNMSPYVIENTDKELEDLGL